MTLTICRGYPGSGKTTWAIAWVNMHLEKRARVNRDELRFNLYGKYTGLSNAQEQEITRVQKKIVGHLLERGYDVIVDDTNLRLRTAREWRDLAIFEGVEFFQEDFETTADECVRRVMQRVAEGGRYVPEDVIRGFAKRYPLKQWVGKEVPATKREHDTKPAKYVPDYTLPPAIIVDLDGTLAKNLTGREFYGKGLLRVYEDEVNTELNGLVGNYYAERQGCHVIFMSGRNECARAETVRWLEDKAGWQPDEYQLYMRADGDMRKDFEVKGELFDQHVRGQYNVLLCFDDRDQIVRLWRDMGLTCYQVNDGAF